ncbi:unnamed protein product [Hermetia illucens]|uniref:Uncharacterized protein n=1 Tax=Hermetia illucens TaxID=343691 RepID=A0A7R8UX25_HERIL|nr:unnamed protein product [Hermetia illucens]
MFSALSEQIIPTKFLTAAMPNQRSKNSIDALLRELEDVKERGKETSYEEDEDDFFEILHNGRMKEARRRTTALQEQLKRAKDHYNTIFRAYSKLFADAEFGSVAGGGDSLLNARIGKF